MCICGVCMQNAQLGGNMYYIGVDLGTSAVKLLLMEESGKICNIVSKEYPLFFPHPLVRTESGRLVYPEC